MTGFADHSPQFIRFAGRHGKTFTSSRDAFETLFAPSILFAGEVLSRVPMRIPETVQAPRLEFGMIEVKDLPQGVVALEDGIYCAALYHTYSLCLLELYLSIANDPSVLAFTGNAGLERRRPFYVGGASIGFQHRTEDFPRGGNWETFIDYFTPRDPARRDLALYMMHAAMRFLWFHELGHVLDGHVDYVRSQRRLVDLFVHTVGVGPANPGELDARALELIADAVAAQLWLKGLIDHDDPFMPATVKNLPMADRLLVALTALLVLSWFWFARDVTVAEELHLQGTLTQWTSHPGAIARLSRLIGHCRRICGSRTDWAPHALDSAFEKLTPQSEALAAMHKSMEFLRVAQAPGAADAVFAAPFIPPKPVFALITELLEKYSYIYRFCPTSLCAPDS